MGGCLLPGVQPHRLSCEPCEGWSLICSGQPGNSRGARLALCLQGPWEGRQEWTRSGPSARRAVQDGARTRPVPGTGSAWGWHTQASPPSCSMDQGWDPVLLAGNGSSLCLREGMQLLEITAQRFHTCGTHGGTPGLSPVLCCSRALLCSCPDKIGEFVLMADLLCCAFRMGRILESGSWSGGRSKVFPGGLRLSSPTEPRPSARRPRACAGCSGLETENSPR